MQSVGRDAVKGVGKEQGKSVLLDLDAVEVPSGDSDLPDLLGVPAPLQFHQLPLLFLVPPLHLSQPHPVVQLHGIHVLDGRLDGEHLGRGEARQAETV